MPIPTPPSLIDCPAGDCGHQNLGTARHCARCGQPLPATTDPVGDVHFTAGLDSAGPTVIPELPAGATAEEKEEHWYRYVYQGDNMKQLTLRAVLMGGVLGMFMSVANLYTTLKVGWSFGVAITACVLSFVFWNGFRKVSGHLFTRVMMLALVAAATIFAWWKVVPTLTDLATTKGLEGWTPALVAYGTAALLVGAAVALTYLLWKPLSEMSLLENNCMQSTASASGYSTGATIATAFGAMLIITGAHIGPKVVFPFTLLTAAAGVFLAIPMKRQMINIEQLKFPSGVLAATTLRSLYSRGAEAVRKAYALVASMIGGALVGFFNTPATGAVRWFDSIVAKFSIPDLVPHRGIFTMRDKQLIGFGFEPSVLLIGAGMIVGLRVSLSMLLGSALLYFVVAPWLINIDAQHAGATGYIVSVPLNTSGTVFRVTQWSLWGGTAVMVFASLTSVALQWRTMARSFSVLKRPSAGAGHLSASSDRSRVEVPIGWLIAGMIPITLGLIIVQYYAFQIQWWLGAIAVGMSFLLSLVACRATGETDTTPIGAMGKVMQLLFAGLSPGNVQSNLMAASVAANSASSSADLLTDLKSGYILGANPRRQFLAQFYGIFFGALAIVPGWYLMVPDKAAIEKFNPPATNMWLAVAQALTKGLDYVPHSARVAIVIGALLGIGLPVAGTLFPKLAKYLPSAMGLGLSWVVTFTNSLSFAIGAVIAWAWGKWHQRTADTYVAPIASGLVAGESLIKALIAMIATGTGLLAKAGAH